VNFDMFPFDPRIAAAVKAVGYQVPTPIQQQAIPPILAGRDLLGLAQTGTGKTAAFVLPILEHLLPGPRGHVRVLILAPTRELAEQLHDAIGVLGANTGIRSVAIYGGVGKTPQLRALRDGAEIIVACPGRLLDHLNERGVSLSGVDVLVLDEADQMFDRGFLPDIRKILAYVPTKRQTLLFSATMPPDIRHLAHEVLHDAVTVQVGQTVPVGTVAHALYPVAPHLKTPLLLALLEQTRTESVLVFTRTKHRARRVGEQLQKAGYRAASLQGNLAQARRQAALDGFRDGTHQILVATDIAARGIDVTQISHVINYDIPDTAEAYTHRIGRTGRALRTGEAFTLITDEDTLMVRAIERVLGAPVARRQLPGFDYRLPAPAKDTEFARPPQPPRRAAPRRAATAGARPTTEARPAAPRRGSAPAPLARENIARPTAPPRETPAPARRPAAPRNSNGNAYNETRNGNSNGNGYNEARNGNGYSEARPARRVHSKPPA